MRTEGCGSQTYKTLIESLLILGGLGLELRNRPLLSLEAINSKDNTSVKEEGLINS